MSPSIHRIWILSLFAVAIAVLAYLSVSGFTYYTTSPSDRATIIADLDSRISDIDVEIELMKEGLGVMGKTADELQLEKRRLLRDVEYWKDWGATGIFGHGLGIAGSLMMLSGVALYSTRKRVKRFRFTGKIKHFLEFHIFLCLLGPALVLLHTTFKFGGIVSVSLWSMLFVALSGIAGRYLYTKIPKTSDGEELSLETLNQEDKTMRVQLRTRYHIGQAELKEIESLWQDDTGYAGSITASVLSLLRDDLTRNSKLKKLRAILLKSDIPAESVEPVIELARKKALLSRKIAFLGTARALFHYWHVIHIPFSIIMFLILIVHVILTVSLGYTWIF